MRHTQSPNKDENRESTGNKLEVWDKNNLASDAGKSIYDNWAKPVTEMSYSPTHPKNKRL